MLGLVKLVLSINTEARLVRVLGEVWFLVGDELIELGDK